jgi:hypothetical protein
MSVIEYQLVPTKPKYYSRKKRQRMLDETTWRENPRKNQWVYKDYKCYYIVITEHIKGIFTATCSGAMVGKYKTLDEAKSESLKFCDNILK